jgi:hypothetical protein
MAPRRNWIMTQPKEAPKTIDEILEELGPPDKLMHKQEREKSSLDSLIKESPFSALASIRSTAGLLSSTRKCPPTRH